MSEILRTIRFVSNGALLKIVPIYWRVLILISTIFIFCISFNYTSFASESKKLNFDEINQYKYEEIINLFRASILGSSSFSGENQKNRNIKWTSREKKFFYYLLSDESVSEIQLSAIKNEINLYSFMTSHLIERTEEFNTYETGIPVLDIITLSDKKILNIRKMLISKGLYFEDKKDIFDHLCTMQKVYNKSGVLIQSILLISSNLNPNKYRECVNTTFFHSFYPGDPVGRLEFSDEKKIYKRYPLDLLNIKILYDDRISHKYTEFFDQERIRKIVEDSVEFIRKCNDDAICKVK